MMRDVLKDWVGKRIQVCAAVMNETGVLTAVADDHIVLRDDRFGRPVIVIALAHIAAAWPVDG